MKTLKFLDLIFIKTNTNIYIHKYENIISLKFDFNYNAFDFRILCGNDPDDFKRHVLASHNIKNNINEHQIMIDKFADQILHALHVFIVERKEEANFDISRKQKEIKKIKSIERNFKSFDALIEKYGMFI